MHVAVIMDGNGRWARRRGLPRVAGHRKGVESVRDLVRSSAREKVTHLTLFAFSSENWQRPPTEVKLLIELLISTLETEIRRLGENGVRLRIIGDLDRFGTKVKILARDAQLQTRDNSDLHLTVAVNYGGRWDITQAARQMARKVAEGTMDWEAVDESTLQTHLSTTDLPDPDLFIRTGGESRVSNFLLWQLAYTELYFTNTLWPDFDAKEFRKALDWFSSRERRFGKTGEQVAAQSG